MSRPCPRWLPWLLASCLGAAVHAQAPGGRFQPVDLIQDPLAVHVDRLCVKLAEGSDAEVVDGRLLSHVGVDFAPVMRCLADAEIEPLITAVSRAQLDAWHAHACDVLPVGRRPGSLKLWFRVRARDATAAAAVAASLCQQPLVEHLHYEPRWALAGNAGSAAPLAPSGDLPPTTPLFTALQLSHGPSPDGHGAWATAGIYGARGTGIGLRMLEGTWILDHEDLSQLVAANFLGPVPVFDPTSGHHGASGCSIVCADRNEYGMTGIADGVSARFVGVDVNGGIENSLTLALASSQPGDVFLMVLMTLMPSLGPGTWLPVEFFQSVFDTSLTVTSNGCSLVVPAGNGNRSLDDPILLNRFDRSFRDSGAVIVSSTEGVLLQRAGYSNWGSRIDANSWGDGVIGCGYGTLFFGNNDIRQAYTAAATGTSSSTPHVAGMIAVLQGAAKKQLGHLLTNAQILNALHSYGPLSPDVIGRRLDLVQATTALGIRDGLSLAFADVPLGGTIAASLEGPPTSILALFGSFAAVDLPVGLNRDLHLDPASLVSLGVWFLNGAPGSYTLPVPNTTSLHGVDLFFQAVRLLGAAPLYLTNSCQVTIF